jgi:hypothetical protein
LETRSCGILLVLVVLLVLENPCKIEDEDENDDEDERLNRVSKQALRATAEADLEWVCNPPAHARFCTNGARG